MKKKRIQTSINNGAIADISFLLLIFFMVVTTFNRDFKLDMKLPPNTDILDSRSIPSERLLKVYLNANGEFLVSDILDDGSDAMILVDELERITSFDKAGKLILNIHPNADYQDYLRILNRVKQARNILKNNISLSAYDMAYYKLRNEQKSIIDDQIRFSITEKEINI